MIKTIILLFTYRGKIIFNDINHICAMNFYIFYMYMYGVKSIRVGPLSLVTVKITGI